MLPSHKEGDCRLALQLPARIGKYELEVYLGDSGIFYRVMHTEAEQLVGAEPSEAAEPSPGVPLYTF